MSKILTVCCQGLVRSVALADVLKLHFEPVDVIPVGYSENANSEETLVILCDWADYIIVMEKHIKERLAERVGLVYLSNFSVFTCEVGPDTYGGKHNRRDILIDKVWRWVRVNQHLLDIKEHTKKL